MMIQYIAIYLLFTKKNFFTKSKHKKKQFETREKNETT